MQETKTRTPADDMPSSRPPWIRAVAIVSAVALLGGALFATWQAVASNEDPEPDPIGLGESEPDFSLSDEQAIARFEELRSSGLKAVESRDVTLLPAVYTSDSPMGQRAREAIANLREDSIVDKTRFETIEIEVLSSTPTIIEL